MRVLVVVPLSPREPKLYAATYAAITALQFDGVLDILWMRNDAATDHSADLADKFNRAAALVGAGEYDAMLIVEYDMIVPPDALTKLLAVDADIVYGLYCSRMTKGHPWLMAADMAETEIIWPTDAARRAAWGGIYQSKGIGTGCTLLKASALEAITFRVGPVGAPDWALAQDAIGNELRQAHHCGVVCGHIISDRHVLWPDPDQPELHRIDEGDSLLLLAADGRYRVRPGHTVVNDRLKATYRAGDIVGLDHGQASMFVRRGIVECV